MSKLLPMLDPFDQIKQIYYSTTRQTIDRDLARALDLLRQMPDDEARQRAAGLMHGLSDLKREWKPKKKGGKPQATATRTGAKSRGQLPTPKGPTPKK